MFKPLDCKFTARLSANVVSYNSSVKIKKKIAQEIMATYHFLQTSQG